MKKLHINFYNHADVVGIAQSLLGKLIVSHINSQTTIVRIVETEAYIGLTDRASHSYAGKRTPRNEHMYGAPGTSYVYICYGMHHLFNVCTNQTDIPDAVLIRAAEPVSGIPVMLQRSGKSTADYTLTKGPGNLSRALGIDKAHSGISLSGNQIYLAIDDHALATDQIGISGRVGIEGAGPAAVALPYRFYIKGNRYVSGSPTR